MAKQITQQSGATEKTGANRADTANKAAAFDPQRLSARYTVRKLTPADAEAVRALCAANPQFYRYCPPFVSRESVLADMQALPPRATMADKFYLGFFAQGALVAVLDLILRYPNSQTAFWGFFMLARPLQGKGEGSRLVQECFACLAGQGYRFVRLGYARGNGQSRAFWYKNGFAPTGVEYPVTTAAGGYTVVVLQRPL